MTSMLVPINELLFRSKNSLYNILFSNKTYDFFGGWSNSDSSKVDWKKRNERWEKIKKYNLESIITKSREWIENSKQNKMREIANKALKNIENQDLTKEKLYKPINSRYCLNYFFNKMPCFKPCLCKKEIKYCDCDCDCDCHRDSVRSIEIEEILVKPKSKPTPTPSPSNECIYKLVSTLLKNNNENTDNNNYKFFGIVLCGVGFGLGTYYFYKKSK